MCMNKNPFAPDFDKLPDTLPVFPLGGVLLLPGGNLPLNIFEQRYLDMIDTAMQSHRMIGMVQPKPLTDVNATTSELHHIGCAGKIVEFNETSDGRYVIALNGISRFRIEEELETTTRFRQVKTSWDGFENDIYASECLGLNREKLVSLLRHYFAQEGMECEWSQINNASDGKLITCLSMICPFDAQEKQALLEVSGCKERAEMFMAMIDMAIQSGKQFDFKTQH